MSIPNEKIVARPMVARACGCMQEFAQYAVDKYRAQRLAKFQKTRCAACVDKLNEQQRLAAAAVPKKGELLLLLPAGTQVSLTRLPNGGWTGTMTIGTLKYEAVGDGTQGVTVSLARLWAAATSPETTAPPAATPVAKPAPKPAPRPMSSPPPRRPS